MVDNRDNSISGREDAASADICSCSNSGGVNFDGDCGSYNCQLLEIVHMAAANLLGPDSWTDAIESVLAKIGEVMGICRVRLFNLRNISDGPIVATPSYFWRCKSCEDDDVLELPSVVDFGVVGLQRWRDVLSSRRLLVVDAESSAAPERKFMQAYKLQSIAMVPVECGGQLWGALGLAASVKMRQWSERELELIQTLGQIIGAAIDRDTTERRTRHSENMFRSLVHNLPVGLIRAECRQDADITMANPAVARIFGYASGSDMVGRSVSRLFEDPDSWLDVLVRSMNNGAVGASEYPCFTASGQRIWVSLTCSLQRDSAGEMAYMEMVFEDITQRKNAENSLRLSEAKYRNLVETQTDMLVRLDEQARFTFLNDAFAIELGSSVNELLGADARLFVHADHIGIFEEAFTRAMATGKKSGTQLMIKTRDGYKWMDWQGYRILSNDGSCELQAVGRDISQQVAAEHALRHERAQLRSVVDIIPDSIYLKDRDGKLLVVNKRFAESVGYKPDARPDDFVGLTDYDIFGSERANSFRRMDMQVMEDGKLVRDGSHKITADGREVWLEYYLAPLIGDDGEITGMVGIVRDVSDVRNADLAVRRERSWLRSVIDALNDAVYLKDTDGRFLLVNQSFADSISLTPGKYTEEYLIGLTDYDLFDKTLADIFRAEDLEVIAGKPIINREQHKKSFAGDDLWLLHNVKSINDDAGDVMGIVGVVSNVTEFRTVQKRLSQERRLLRAVIDTIPNYVYMKDTDGKFVLANESFIKARGLKHESDLLGRSDADFQPPERREHCRKKDAELLATGRPVVNRERLWTNDDGQLCCHIFSSAPVRGVSGEIIGLIGVITDLSELRRAEQAARASRQRYQALVESLPVGVCRLSIKSKPLVQLTNAAAARMFGYESIGSFQEITFADLNMSPSLLRQFYRQLLAEGSLESVSIALVRADGQPWWLLFSASLVSDQRGRPAYVDVIMEDVTNRRRAELALRQAHSELVNARESERRRLAAELHDSLGQSIVAMHMTIQSLAMVAQRIGLDAEAIVDPIKNAATRCGDMVREVRQICHGLYPTVLSTLGLEAALNSLGRDFASHIGVTLEFDPALAGVKLADSIEIALFRIAQEAVSNAVRHGQAEDVFIMLEKNGDALRFAVSDNGNGFDKDIVSGEGLGLKSMAERADAIGAELEIDTAIGEGVSVILTISAEMLDSAK